MSDDEFYQYWLFVPDGTDPTRSLQVGSQSPEPEFPVGRTGLVAVIDRVLAGDVTRAWTSAWAIRCRSAEPEDLLIDDVLDALALLELHYAEADADENITPLDYVCSVQELDEVRRRLLDG